MKGSNLYLILKEGSAGKFHPDQQLLGDFSINQVKHLITGADGALHARNSRDNKAGMTLFVAATLAIACVHTRLRCVENAGCGLRKNPLTSGVISKVVRGISCLFDHD